MTQEERELLIKDLCARLPYRFFVHRYGNNATDIRIDNISTFGHFLEYSEGEDFKPYLRPMSSMTEKEIDEIKSLLPFHYGDMFVNDDEIKVFETNGEFSLSHYLFEEIINFYNSHHFDYRGLIKKGLALEAPEGMYKIE